jgi:murein DD-endopeptidase MepM/ murein hydrolase activator NlpD
MCLLGSVTIDDGSVIGGSGPGHLDQFEVGIDDGGFAVSTQNPQPRFDDSLGPPPPVPALNVGLIATVTVGGTRGVNPVTGQPGFTRNPMGQTGHMRPSIGGDGWFRANRGGRPRHSGIDISGVLNVTPVVAFLPGTITVAEHTPGQGGTLVNIDHGNGITSSYVHLQIGSIPSGLVPTRTNPAPQIAQGQRLGTLGDSGNARRTPPHVHFWIRLHGVLQNPETFLNQACPP